MPTRLGPKSGPILALYLPDPETPGGQVRRAWMGQLTEATIAPDKGGTLLTSPYEGEDAQPWWLKGTALQSAEAASLWRFAWQYSGLTVPYSWAMLGNQDAAPDAPILRGEVVVGPRPQAGGSADATAFTFGIEWQLTGEPVLDLGEGGDHVV